VKNTSFCHFRRLGLLWWLTLALLLPAWSQAALSTGATCARPATGAVASEPPEMRSRDGVLELTLHFKYQATVLGEGPPRYCYTTSEGLQDPTLRVRPGDWLIIHFQNDLAPIEGLSATMPMPQSKSTMSASGDPGCSGGPMNASGTNLHFHGLDLPPVCHQDDVLHTLIQPGQNFEYRVRIPKNQSPGLYWYHPHLHGFTERQVQGGASGALIVAGLEDVNSSLQGLSQRLLVLRDQSPTNPGMERLAAPAWDISINQVPIIYPQYQPAIIQSRPGEKELWRVLNAAADTIFDLQVIVNHVPQALELVAQDGIAVAGGASRRPLMETNIALPPGARAEFIVRTPNVGDQAQLVTGQWDTGPEGDIDPSRPIANIVSYETAGMHEAAPPV
jgi:FtsP/CotA-like multicopper oxidase with cupredoxin domain